MLIAISEPCGTISLSRWRKDNEGGRRELMLKTLGSTSNLWLATEPSVVKLVLLCKTPDHL